jgi:hypothetical protein
VHRNARGRNLFERDSIGTGREHTTAAQPARAFQFRAWTRGHSSGAARDITRGIVPKSRPAGSEKNDIALLIFYLLRARGSFQMIACNGEVGG